jgi:hypothetical protein
MKRKYLHVEISLGSLHIYADDRRWPGDKLVTLDEIDTECNLHDVEDGDVCFTVPINEFLN